MKKLLLFTLTASLGSIALAQEVGRVLSVTPVTQQVGIPRQVCTTEPVEVAQPKSGAGALMGAIAGGALGNAAGRGGGQAAATMLGIFGGAIVGDSIEAPATTQLRNVQRCSTQTFYENRALAYDVVYEFAGKQYAVQLPHDPGPEIALQITPAGAALAAPSAPVSTHHAPPVMPAAPQPYYGQPYDAPPYYAPPYYPPLIYPPLSVELDFGYRDGYRAYSHRHGYRNSYRR